MTQIVLIWSLFICAQLADVWTTNKVLSQGGRELNGLVAGIMREHEDKWGWVKFGLAMCLGLILHFYQEIATRLLPENWVQSIPEELGHWIMLAVGLITAAVAANNFGQIK